MKLIFSRIRMFNKTTFIAFVFLFSNVTSFSQQSNNDKKLVANINMNKLENSELEQSIRQVKSEKITKHLKLSLKEKDLLLNIKELSTEAKQCVKDADLVVKEINEIKKTIVNTNEIENKLKIEKKINRQEKHEISLRYDAEELFEMGNSLLFKIYEDHFPTTGVLMAKNHKYQKQIIELNEEAQELYKKANINQEKASYDFNFEDGIDYLKKANLLKLEAIKKYEQAYSLYYNMPINKSEYPILSADLNTPNERKPQSVISNLTETKAIINETKANVELNEPLELIVYKVQIGAFTKKIDVNEFHGLTPLSEDKKDQQEFVKYMVGEYYSYKAASEAKRIISSSTKYQDAFIVAYKNDKRVAFNNVLKK